MESLRPATARATQSPNIKFTDRRRYYSAFDSYYRLNDMSPMVTMVAEYVEEGLDRYLQILSG